MINKKIFTALIISILSISLAAQKNDKNKGTLLKKEYVSEVWKSDQGDGTFINPVLHADYSDPDVIRVGKDFYMTASSFNCAPGLPILHSKDLINWTIINYALEKIVPEKVFNVPQHSKGVWAPSMRYHNNEFYIYWGDPDFGVYMIKTKNPATKWEAPVLVMEGKGIIDPCPLWDGDKAYLVHGWAGSRAGINSLLTINEMNKTGTSVIDQGRHIFDGHDKHHTVEGPKIYKKDGWYYVFAPAGGVAEGWQLVLRSKNIYGPYEEKVVLEQGNTLVNGPHQGAWITTQKGDSWFMHFQDKGVYGRVLHLQEITWKDGWPLMGKDLDGNGIGEPLLKYKKPNIDKQYPIQTPQESDDFNNGKPGIQWQWYGNPSVTWSAQILGTDYLRLFCTSKKELPNLWDAPNLLLQKLPAENFTSVVKVRLGIEWETGGKTAGILMMGQSYAYVGITHEEGSFWVKQVTCTDAIKGSKEKIMEKKKLQNNEVYLKMQVRSPAAESSFSYSEDGINFKPLGENFKAQKDLWISAKMGIFSVSEADVRLGSYADFDWFKVLK